MTPGPAPIYMFSPPVYLHGSISRPVTACQGHVHSHAPSCDDRFRISTRLRDLLKIWRRRSPAVSSPAWRGSLIPGGPAQLFVRTRLCTLKTSCRFRDGEEGPLFVLLTSGIRFRGRLIGIPQEH